MMYKGRVMHWGEGEGLIHCGKGAVKQCPTGCSLTRVGMRPRHVLFIPGFGERGGRWRVDCRG